MFGAARMQSTHLKYEVPTHSCFAMHIIILRIYDDDRMLLRFINKTVHAKSFKIF